MVQIASSCDATIGGGGASPDARTGSGQFYDRLAILLGQFPLSITGKALRRIGTDPSP